MAKSKGIKKVHTPATQMGSGDFYGSGVKAKLGTLRESYMPMIGPDKKKHKPPKSLA